jgi:hypothetical protein
MMPYGSYQLFEAERPKSTCEWRAADARRGEFAAAISRPVTAAGAQVRAMMPARRRARGARVAESLECRAGGKLG